MTRQSKVESLIEAGLNTASGLVIALVLTAFFQKYDNPILFLGDGLSNVEIFLWTGIMTAVSIARSYIWRRLFANEAHKFAHKFSQKLLNKK